MFLHENFSDVIPHCASASDPQCPITVGIFDPATPTSFAFSDSRPSLEQSAYVQDAIRLGNWTINAGLRWDHYQLLVNQNAVSPRLSVARYFHSSNVVVHASYDRVFQTPSFENILLSSSPAVQSLDSDVLRLPVKPSHGNYYEVGISKGFSEKLRVDANYYRRSANNAADDDQILNTSVSFPIAFAKTIVYGAEAKIEVPKWGRFSGFVSYSYMVGNVWFPVTGGLFLANEPVSATIPSSGHFPDTQDQRHTVRARVRYQLSSRVWMAVGTEYNTGLPFDFQGTPQLALAEYGQAVLDHLNFERGRIHPVLLENASIGADLYRRELRSVRLQADCQNLSNTLDVLDFGGLFSGNAIGPQRSYSLRLIMKF
jgi:outer membrane receptor protein involved in Fe transport